MKILGITHPYSTNNAACLLVDGQLVAFAEEERFLRYKHAPETAAKRAADYCLKTAGLTLADIDYIAVGMADWQKCIWPNLRGQSFKYAQAKIRSTVRAIRLLRWRQPFNFNDPRVINVNHHSSHLASSFYLSGFDQANIITLDGAGEAEAGLLAVGEGIEVEILERVTNEASWGALYEQFTGILGFKKHSEEGKVMGLASYGVPDKDLFDFIDWETGPIPKINSRKRDEFSKKLIRRQSHEPITQGHKDLAATLQYNLEKAVLAMVKYLHEKSGYRKLCLAGGVALNCSMNGQLLRSEDVDDIFIQPASSDAGSALGAAVHVYVQKTGQRPNFIFEHAYWGPEFSDAEIEVIIKECKVTKWHKADNIFKESAQKMADNKIVGWFQGRMEVGPRALGNRSIVANPANPRMKDEVNNNVKKRESWRPFAPSALEEYASEYVENYHSSPFMILAFDVKKGKEKEIVSASHVDHTVRLQTVSRKTNERYWNLINEFRAISGIPVVLNTSFNLAGEPIVCNPRDAIRTFYGSGMDCLAIGNYLIEK